MGRWRLDERGELIVRGIATGGDMVKESTESPARERRKKKKRIGSKWKGRRKKRQRERETENKEAWRLCLLAQSAIIPPPLLPLTSPSSPASLYRAKTQVSILYTHTHTPRVSYVKVDLLFLSLSAPLYPPLNMFILQSAHRGPNKHLVNESVLSVYNKFTGYGPLNNLS